MPLLVLQTGQQSQRAVPLVGVRRRPQPAGSEGILSSLLRRALGVSCCIVHLDDVQGFFVCSVMTFHHVFFPIARLCRAYDDLTAFHSPFSRICSDTSA